MRDIEYAVRGFLTVQTDFLRVPLHGTLVVHVDPRSGQFTGDLVLREVSVTRAVLGVGLFSAGLRIEATSPVTGEIDDDGRMVATATVDAVMTGVRAGGFPLIEGGSCRTARAAVVPLRSQPGFDLDRGGNVTGRYNRPPFTGAGRLTPLVNMLLAGYGNAIAIDLTPRAPSPGCRAASPGRCDAESSPAPA